MHFPGMTVSALGYGNAEAGASSPSATQSDNTVGSANQGYQSWLEWLQSQLSATGLFLYRLDTSDPASSSDIASLELMGCLPDSTPQAPRYAVLAMQSARADAVVNARSDKSPKRSLCCIPDTSTGKNRRFRHVLVILHSPTSTLDAHRQATFVAWAFAVLTPFCAFDKSQTGTAPNTLTQWVSEQLHDEGASGSLEKRLMDKLADITSSTRCLLAAMRVKAGCVDKVSLLALSGQARLDTRLSAASTLLSSIEMSFVGKSLPLDHSAENDVQPAMLAKSSIDSARGSCHRLILPLPILDVCFAVMLERASDKPFGIAEINELQDELHGALLLAHLSDPQGRSVKASMLRTVQRAKKRVVSSVPGTAIRAALLVAVVIFIAYPAEHRVSAPVNVEAAERHVLIAPVDGYVESVAVRAGDAVVEGQTLATLDDSDLQLQRHKRQSEALQNTQAYAKALALHDRVEVSRLKESAALIETELKLLDLQQQRMTIKAPVDGVILSGSWDDSLGAAVGTGDTLFTLGTSSSHRLILDVSEYDVSKVITGQSIDIRLSADPSTVLLAKVTAVMPLAFARAGVNTVQVHAEIARAAQLRPGMQGIGKIVTGHQVRIVQWLERISARFVWLAWRLGVLT